MKSLDYEALLDISLHMAETRVVDPLLEYTIDIALEITDSEFGYLVLIDEDDRFDFKVKRSSAGYSLSEDEIEISHSIVRKSVEARKPVMTADAVSDPGLKGAASVQDLKLRSVACAPLIAKDRVIGGLYLENRSELGIYDEENLKLLRFFANQAAIAIENAMLNSELEARVSRRTAEFQAANDRLLKEMEERQRIENEMIRMAVEQEQANMIAQFIQDASHQFRTPLAIINTKIDLLKRKIDNTDVHQYLADIREQGNDILQLVDSLAIMSRLDESKDPFAVDTIDLNALLRSLWEGIQQDASAKQLHVEAELAESPVMIKGDLEQLTLALMQIIDNAVQYTPEGGTVHVQVGEADGRAVVSVSDTGQGIAEEDLPLVFTRFFRSDKVGTTRGFGLGLAIAQKIMRIHRGTIEVESQPGAGSTFHLVFPAD